MKHYPIVKKLYIQWNSYPTAGPENIIMYSSAESIQIGQHSLFQWADAGQWHEGAVEEKSYLSPR